MKSFACATLFVVVCSVCRAQTVEIVSPQGGEYFVVGQAQTVRLFPRSRFRSVRIELSRDGGATFELLGVIDNTVSREKRNVLEFTVTGPASENCRVRAVAESLPNSSGLSGTFSIHAATTAAPGGGPVGAAGGDLSGSYPNPAIAAGAVNTAKLADAAVTSQKVSSGAASSGAVLTADGIGRAEWLPLPASIPAPAIQLAGDVTGDVAATQVQGLRGLPLSANAPANGQVLKFNAATNQWEPSADNSSGGTVTGLTALSPLTVSGTATPQIALVTAGVTDGQVLKFNIATGQWEAAADNSLPAGPAAGDLSGTYPNPTVATVGGQSAASVASGAVAANAATDANTAGAIVKRDASGNFAAGTVTANLTGTASNAANLNGQPASFYLDAANLTGTLSDARMSGNVALLAGRAGGQTLNGGVGAGETLTLDSTAHATKGDIILAPAGGNVGIGATPGQKLSVAGTVESTSGGFKFPDGTTQTTATIGGGVPAGFVILGETPTPPTGFTYTSQKLELGWIARAPVPTPREWLTACAVNGKIYAMGGQFGASHYATNEEYDPVTNTWTARAPMLATRTTHAAGVLNGKIYVLGGIRDAVPYSTSLEEYDPTTDTWSTKAPMPTGRSWLVVGVVGGKLYAIGGSDGAGSLAVVEEYDPIMNSWATKAPMPTERYRAAAGVVNGRIYVFGGQSLAGTTAVNEEYDPVANTWSAKAPMPIAQESHAAGVVNGKIYSVGGVGESSYTNVQEYDTVLNTWQRKVPMEMGRTQLAVATVNETLFAIGGVPPGGPLSAVNEEYNPTTYYVFRKD